MRQPSPVPDLPAGRRLRINQVNVDTVELEDPTTGCSTLVPRSQAPAEGILDPRQMFFVEAVPGQPDLCVVRWWYGLEECVTRDRIPRVAVAQSGSEIVNTFELMPTHATNNAAEPLPSSIESASAPDGAKVSACWGGDGAVLCTDEQWLVACGCGRRELVHPHSPMLLAGVCRECLPGELRSPAETLLYPHICFSPN